ncbi:(deoxy)nucleoside triphosphate pyrophosphohydrolase [Thermosulfuriphilus sp.]
MIKRTQVVAALILNETKGTLLLCRRPEGKIRGGLWEFPGGKLEPGEDLETALFREIAEELGIEIEVKDLLSVVDHDYPEGRIRLYGFLARIRRGCPQALEGQSLAWVAPGEVGRLNLAPADRRLWEAIEEAGGINGF